jgi:hypothetical protein
MFKKFEHVRVNEIACVIEPLSDTRDADTSWSLTKLFMNAITKKLRGIQFGSINGGGHIHAYYPDEVFTRGRISHGDVRQFDDGEYKPTYNVSSPFISNGKTTDWNASVYFRLTSVNIDTAVRNAVKYLRKFTPVNIVQATIDKVDRGRRSISTDEQYALRAICEKIVDRPRMLKALFRELQHLNNVGHKFCDPELGSNVAEYFVKHAEHMENEDTGKNYTFVYVETVGGQHQFTTIPMPDLSTLDTQIGMNRTCSDTCADMIKSSVVSDELPDDVLSKVSVLTVSQDGTFLDGVGYKFCDEVYYVYK